MLDFAPADVTRPADVRQLIAADHPATLVYLALPPGLLPSVLTALTAAHLRATDAVAIEKPFGTDPGLGAAPQPDPAPPAAPAVIFRVDHFLSNELVRRVITLRFLNRVFEPTSNAAHIDHVDISWLESLTLEGRATLSTTRPCFKDMVQNHLT